MTLTLRHLLNGTLISWGEKKGLVFFCQGKEVSERRLRSA